MAMVTTHLDEDSVNVKDDVVMSLRNDLGARGDVAVGAIACCPCEKGAKRDPCYH
jgi:hypothetical protein